LKSKKRQNQGFRSPRKVEDFWSLYKKDLYVEKPPNQMPPWMTPLITFVVIVLVIFWAAPTVLHRLEKGASNQNQQQPLVARIYDQTTWVVKEPVADVFAKADLKAGRLTQVLYNEPVTVLPANITYGFSKVKLGDGTQGYMLTAELSQYRDAIEPALAINKLVVATTTKRIMSHANKGSLVAEVMMGTILYADYRGDGISRVQLPSGDTGWVSDDGLVILPPDGKITPVADGARYFCSSAMAFHNVTILTNGQSVNGVSLAGVARVAAFVNGVTLPRSMADQMTSGQAVALKRNKDTSQVDFSQLKPGDLVFFARADQPDKVAQMAICIDDRQLLVENQGQSAIRLMDPTQNLALWSRVMAIRRIF
jgi:predicted RecA/RadA family phage recombinase